MPSPTRPLEKVYPILWLDALFIPVRDEGHVRKKAFYLALGVTAEGKKEVLGIWIAPTEGAKFWLSVLTDLKNRGVEDIFIACVDGLSGFPDAIEAAFPRTCVQQCVVHLVRNSLKFVPRQHFDALCKDLRQVYLAPTIEEGLAVLEDVEDAWGQKYPMVPKLWRNAWERVSVCFAFPEPVRRVLYTTNAIESLNSVLRRAMRNRASFVSEEAALTVLYLSLARHSRSWRYALPCWSEAKNYFAILFEGRMPA